MARNVEIKARLADRAAVAARAAALADEGPTEIAQDDTFFACANGRLKLRVLADGSGQLIYYRRADEAGPKESFFVLSPTAAPDSLRETLTLALGATGRVRKQRTLFLVGRTRIHLDRVEGLGDFLELEVVLGEVDPTAEGIAEGIAEAHALLARLGIEPSALVEGAYLDLLRGAR